MIRRIYLAGGHLLRRRDSSAVSFLNNTNWECPTSRVFREVGRRAERRSRIFWFKAASNRIFIFAAGFSFGANA
jgi:hypothetical protein